MVAPQEHSSGSASKILRTAKNFANSRGIDRGEIEELSFCSPDTIGDDGVQMREELGSEGTERLDRHDTPGPNVFAVKQRLHLPLAIHH